MKNTLRIVLMLFTALVVMPVKAEIFICMERGKQVMKNSDNCSGKIKGVYSGDNTYQSYSDYLATKNNNEVLASKAKKISTVEPTLEELKARCNHDFNELATFTTHSKRGDKLLGILTKNKCATTSVSCYKDFDNFITDLKNGGGTHSHRGDQQIADNLQAKCGLPEEPKPKRARFCNTVGDSVICDNGVSYQKIGNAMIGTDGTSAEKIGDLSIAPDGSTSQRVGNTIRNSDGSSCEIIGNQMICN